MVKPPRRKHPRVELQPLGTYIYMDGKLEIPQSDQSLGRLPNEVYVYPTLLESTKSLNDTEPPYI